MSDSTETPRGTADPFGAPLPHAVRGRGNGSSYIDPAGIHRDRWDRPVLPHPHTGQVQPWTSVTTLAGTLADRYALGQWQLRQAVKGMGIRHDLAALAAGTPSDDSGKATMQRIASDAMEAAGSSAGRNTGSALHALTEEFDRGTTQQRINLVRSARPDLAADLKAYAQTMEAHGLRVHQHLIERMTVCLATESAGTFDRMVMCPDGALRVADVKTGQHADEYGYYELAQQLAQYANGEALWRVTDRATGAGVWEPFPGGEHATVHRSVGILIWLPAGQARCGLFYVDLVSGMAEALTAKTVRQRRKASKAWVVPVAPPPPPATATQVAEVLAMPNTGMAGAIRDFLLSAADDAGVLTATPEEMRAATVEANAYDADVNPRQQFVDGGHAGCVECTGPGEDPTPWCDCRDNDTCPVGQSCRNRAHDTSACPALQSAKQDITVADLPGDGTVIGPDRQPGWEERDIAVSEAIDHMVVAASEAAERGTAGAAEALDALLLRRVQGAPDVDTLMALATQHAGVWTADLQTAAAQRWEALTSS